MGNHRGLGFHLLFVFTFVISATYTCLGDRSTSDSVCSEKERLALLKFIHSIKQRSEMLSSWVGNDCCVWEGIHCDSGTETVESLHLTGCSIANNEMSSSLGELRHLKSLDLSGNDFKGSRIPKFIGSLKQLIYLNLSHAGFKGIIPHHIGNLSNLKVLDLSSNYKLMADDMVWTFGFSSLEHLGLSSVDLRGAQNIDMLFYMIPSLKELSLSNCGLSNADLRPFLNSSRLLPNIKHLDLSQNSIGGIFPSFITKMSSLRVLDLSGNMLNSSVPVMPNLLELYLSSNQFKQVDDVGIWRQCHLEKLHASHNYFELEMIDSPKKKSECSNYALEWLHLRSCSNGTIPEPLGRLSNIRGIDLSSSGLTGPIPESFGRLRYLEILDLSFNRLTSPIPTFLGNLSTLDLSFNNLNGSIPESFGNLAALTYLGLSSNRLTGPIPESLGRLRYLEVLALSDNQLTGPIAKFLGNLSTVDLSFGNLNGSITESFGNPPALTYLGLNSNRLTGLIPTSIGQLAKLQFLNISNNSLEGILFDAHFANLSMLKSFDASSSPNLTFNVSPEWIPPFQLRILRLSSCNITNGFPQWLRYQRNLDVLKLSKTTIYGPLPTRWRKMPIIPYLDLSHNKLFGPLTNLPKGAAYDRYENVSVLLLQNNFFNESIPRSLYTRIDLEYLDLSINRLTGKIPKCPGNLQQLSTMILSSNQLSGVIPWSITRNSLRWLKLNDNNFVGELPRKFGNFYSLNVLDVGENKLYGNIPDWVGENLNCLVVLRFHKNNFTGRIPESLCKSSYLQILDVAHNNLDGPIPRCLGELKAMVNDNGWGHVDQFSSYQENVVPVVMKGVDLEYTTPWDLVFNMDLSSNKLFGEIPVELTALSMLMGLNLSNNYLSGYIPYPIGYLTALNSLDLSGNELVGAIPPSMADLTFLSRLNLSHNNLSGRIPTGRQLQTLIDPSIYEGNKDLCGPPLPNNCSNPTTSKKKYKAIDEQIKVWLFYSDIICGFAIGFWGVIGVLLFKKQWRCNLFMFVEEMVDKIYAVVVRVAKMKRRREVA